MLYLYDKNKTDFTNNGEPLRHAYDAHVVREEGFYLKFKLLLDEAKQYKSVHKEMIVSAMTPDGINQFRVYDIIKFGSYVEVVATQLMYDFDNKEVNSLSVTNASGTQVIDAFKGALKSTLGQFTLSSIVTETHDFTTDSDGIAGDGYNALEILNRIASRWDSEFLVNGFDIRMIKRLGSRTNALLYEKKNISEFADESSMRDIVTRIHAVSRYIPEGSEEETVIKVTVDSPLINEYAQIYEKTYQNNSARTQSELLNWVNLKFSTENIDKPSRNIRVETNIIDDTEINYGDELVLKYLVHDVDEVIRCVGYDFDPISEEYYNITLGGWRDSFTSVMTGNLVNNTNRQIDSLKRSNTQVINSANGKNRTAYGTIGVPNPINGDLWYYYTPDRPNDVELRIYQDGFWVAIDFAMDHKVDEALTAADTAKTEADQARIKADEALAEVGISTDLAQTAKDLAQLAEDNAETALTNAQSALNEAGLAASQATQAINTADTAKTNAQTALTNAQTALTEAGSAKTTADNLTVRVDDVEAEVELKASQTTVDGLSGTVTSNSTTLSQHANQIASKAESNLVNTIKDTVDTHTTEIKQNATDISSKASSLSVNTLTGRVSTAETTISQHATSIASKASQTEVDTVKGTVSSHTSTLSQHATQISARLTSTQVSDLVDGKGLAKVTYVDNQISATANSFGVELTRIEGKIPQSYTEENLVKNSKEYISTTQYLIKEFTLAKQLELGKVYTLVLDGGIGATGSDQEFGIWFDAGQSFQIALQNLGNGIFRRTFTLRQSGANSGDKSNFRLYNVPNRGASATIRWIKLIEGSDTDNNYTPSRSDLFTQNEYSVFKTTFDASAAKWNLAHSYVNANQTKINSLISNADGWQTTISYVDSNKTQINETIAQVNSFKQTIGTNGEKIAQLVMTDSLFSTKVLESIDIGGRNYAQGATDKMQYNLDVNRYSGSIIPSLASKFTYTLNDLNAKAGDTYTASIYIGAGGGYGSGLRIDNQTGTSQHYSPQVAHGYSSVTFTVKPTDTEFRFYLANYSGNTVAYKIEAREFKIEKGNKRTDWTPAPEDKANQSQVTQLANSWALTLKSGNDIKTQINASTDSIRLDSKFIHLSGTSLIDNATIKSAHIESINANKITTGTLNAANVNIVNLNASSISAGTLTAIKLSGPSLNIDLSSGEVNFSKGSIKSANTEWNLSENYMNLEYTSNTGISNRNRIVIGGPNDIKFYDNYNFSSKPDTLLGFMSMTRISGSPDVLMNFTTRASDGSGGDYISLRSDGSLYFSSLEHVTTSGTANVFSTASGSIHRVTSALKYKADVQVAEDAIIDAKKILQLKPKSWLDKAELRDTGTSKRYYGFVADDFNQIGLTQVVSYFNGEVDSLNYDRLSIYHNVILSEHEQKIIELENRIEELESQLSA